MPRKLHSRRWILGSLTGLTCLAPLSAWAFQALNNSSYRPGHIAAGKAVVQKHISVDLHSHPGIFFVNTEQPTDFEKTVMTKTGGTFVPKTMADMMDGGLTACVMSTVADMPILNVNMEKGKVFAARKFREGESWKNFQAQNQKMAAIIKGYDCVVARTSNDIKVAKASGRLAVIMSTEGASYLDHDLGRLEVLYDKGYRNIQLVHYHVNQIGDIQTEVPVYNGLSAFGKEVVQEMARLGLVIDLAHASEDTVNDVAGLTQVPLVVSHSGLCSDRRCHPRYQTRSQAITIAQTGGIVGLAPSGFLNRSFEDYINEIDYFAQEIGVDHVALGTDMDANYKPVFDNYADLYLIPTALIARGYNETDIAKIMGGNFMRVFEQITRK